MLILAMCIMGLGIFKGYEPLLLIPIGFGAFLANIEDGGMSSHSFDASCVSLDEHGTKTSLEDGAVIYTDKSGNIVWKKTDDSSKDLTPALKVSYKDKGVYFQKIGSSLPFRVSGVTEDDGTLLVDHTQFMLGEDRFLLEIHKGLLANLYGSLLKSGIIPPLIFMGVGAMTDFGPLMRNVGLAFYGAAAQIGIFIVFIMALVSGCFTMEEAASLGIIGGADGPTAVFLTTKLAPDLLGPIAVAAYSYMALVPVIIPWVVNRLTTPEERKIHMRNQDKAAGDSVVKISPKAKIAFPIFVVLICGYFVPSSTVLVGMLMFGNLLKECNNSSVVERLCGAAKGPLINILTIILGLTVGGTMEASSFLEERTLMIIGGGLFAFGVSIAGGILGAKAYNNFASSRGWKLTNPLIGATGLSAVPMASRVANEIALKEDPTNNIIHYCMASNVAGVIGSAVAAGYFLSQLG
ncbi:MAG: sodium ion-translocating decarboxylase subunit beta [Planctomycetes bacterium]|nr:sodium ion-translocating decarboxylase subunit beta [Planctomycetota bacterium]